MTRIIPYELIKHLEWTPDQEVPSQPKPVQPLSNNPMYDLDDILKGRTFHSEERDDNGNYIGVVIALQEALDYVGDKGIIATMPEMIAAKVQAEKEHDFWQKWYTVHTEENIGIDKKGIFYNRDDPVLVVINGGGILTPERIKEAYAEGLIGNSAKYREEEFDDLLEGKLPDGTPITLYLFEDIKNGVSNLPHRFGVVMPYETAQGTSSRYHQKKEFLENPLVIARNGGLENLEEYYENAKYSDGDLGNYHPFDGRDASVPQGRLLYLNDDYYGLNGHNDLDNNGRFVGVAPEAPSAHRP